MKKMSVPVLILLLISFVFSAQIEPVTVDVWSGKATITNDNISIELTANPLNLTIKSGGMAKIAAPPGQMFGFEKNGTISMFVRASTITRRYEGFAADLITADNQEGKLIVTMDAKKHIAIEYLLPRGINRSIFNIDQKQDEHFYGLGDLWDTESVDAKNSRITMWDHTGTPDVCNYVPFFMSTGGYGIFLDTAYRGYFDFGKMDPSKTEMNFESPDLSMHIWLGETMRDILPQYLDMTGYPVSPPDWVFWPQKWRDAGNWDDVFTDVSDWQAHDMPLGVVWIDRPWMLGGFGSDDYLFGEERYPNAKENIEKLHKMGIRLLVWACDFLTPDSRYYQEGMEKGYFINSEGDVDEDQRRNFRYIDFAKPEAREWFKDIIKNALKLGVDGFKLDRGQSYPESASPPSGRNAIEMHNYHAALMVKTFAEAVIEIRGDDFQLTPRAGWAGTQKWTVKWPGDIDSDFSIDKGLPSIIRAQSSAALTGFAFWGSDIPGYGRDADKVEMIRWLQQGVFSPLLQIVGKGNHDRAPFSWDQETTDIAKYWINLRMNMLPYIKWQAEKAHEKGIPIVRHLAWDWPDDPNVHDKSYEYMFGDDLLVACMINEKTERQVYFPAGEWIDFWQRDRIIVGPKTLTETVPLEKFPVYIRKGASFDFKLPEAD